MKKSYIVISSFVLMMIAAFWPAHRHQTVKHGEVVDDSVITTKIKLSSQMTIFQVIPDQRRNPQRHR